MITYFLYEGSGKGGHDSDDKYELKKRKEHLKNIHDQLQDKVNITLTSTCILCICLYIYVFMCCCVRMV